MESSAVSTSNTSYLLRVWKQHRIFKEAIDAHYFDLVSAIGRVCFALDSAFNEPVRSRTYAEKDAACMAKRLTDTENELATKCLDGGGDLTKGIVLPYFLLSLSFLSNVPESVALKNLCPCAPPASSVAVPSSHRPTNQACC